MKVRQLWNNADGENYKNSYRNLSQFYLTTLYSNRTGLPLNPTLRGKKQKVCRLKHGRHWSNANLLRCYVVLISWTSRKTWIFISATVITRNLASSVIFTFQFSLVALFLPYFHFVHPYKCHICAHKSLIPLLVSVSQLTPSYWLLLWRHRHMICGCSSLIAMIMAPLCAWVDWACWLIHRILMQPYTLLNVQTAIWGWGRGLNKVSSMNDHRFLYSKSHISLQDDPTSRVSYCLFSKFFYTKQDKEKLNKWKWTK